MLFPTFGFETSKETPPSGSTSSTVHSTISSSWDKKSSMLVNVMIGDLVSVPCSTSLRGFCIIGENPG